MKYLSSITICLLFFGSALQAQLNTKNQNELDHINYMTNPDQPKVTGTGEPVEEIRQLNAPYQKLILGNGIQVFVTKEASKELRLVAQKELLPLINTTVKDATLIVRLDGSLETYKGIKLYLPLGELSNINVKQGSYLSLDAQIDQLDLLIQSGAIAQCLIQSQELNCTVMGGSTLHLKGESSQKANIFVKGGSELKGEQFQCADGDITVLGASRCRLKVVKHLDARVENESKFVYTGSPKIGKKSTSLNGKIRHRRF